MDNIYSILPLFSCIFVLGLGLFILSKYFKKKEEILLVLFLFCMSVAVWLFGTFMMFVSVYEDQIIFWDRFIYKGVVFVPVLMHHFSIVFANLKEQRKYLSLGYILSFAFFVLSETPWFVSGVFHYQWGSHTYAQFGHHVFLIFFFVYLSVFFINIYNYYKNINDRLARNQSRYVFLAFLILVLFGSPAYLPAYEIAVPPFPFLSGVAFIGILSYAILKHKLLNMRVAAASFLTFVLIVLFFIDILLSNSSTEVAFRVVGLLIVTVVGYSLIKSVQREFDQREKLEELTKELQRANKRLKVVDAMKTEFVSIASHELLTPISAIEGYLSMMLEEKMVKIKDPKAIDYMNRVFQSAKRLARLVTDLLNVSRIEEGRLLVEKSDVHLADIVKTAAGEIKIKAAKEKISLSLDGIEGSKVKLYADGDKIKEVLLNLCSNAVKYNKPGGSVKIAMEYWPKSKVAAAEGRTSSQMEKDEEGDGLVGSVVHEKYREIVGGKQLVISVKDTGIGMDKKDISHLFKKFSRVGDWSTQRTQGTGLGLYISKALVELHHGRMWVESRGRGKGSTFYFSLPTIEAKESVVKLDGQAPKTRNAKPLAKGGLSGG